MPASKRVRVTIAVIAAVAAISAAIAYMEFLRPQQAVDYIEATGEVEATEVEVSSRISGRIVWLCCGQGDHVKAGTVAVRLDGAELDARLTEAKAGVASAAEAASEVRVSLENAKASLDGARQEADAAASEVKRVDALAAEAKSDLDRANGLFAGGFISRKDMDGAKTRYDALAAERVSALARRRGAGANVKNMELGIKGAQSRIQTAEARVTEAEARIGVAETGAADAVINAPIGGVVVYKSFELGETVAPGQSIYTVDDLADVWVRVDIEETDIHRVRLGALAKVFVNWAGGKVYDAKVIEIGELAGFATQRDVTRGRQDIKTFRVKARLANPDGALKPGMTATVRIGEAGGEKQGAGDR
ncbi:MAG: efflux RND transporter periplasmic adaptor subunit [Deltaproteobacteria bacterium]|nr:efflux RND transporter periplasmic adaptor subunit [Deltaproteobacteria bacterium]